ncbi:MAG: hypothetical protein OEW87_12550 [Flavobacteriaceae bacterium]|nr:hypothetical protein [Flavobacteriaceae bacterium]
MLESQTVLKYFVSMSTTGRIVIPKEVRNYEKIKKGDFVYIEKKLPGYLKMNKVDKQDEETKKEIENYIALGWKSSFSSVWGFTHVEENLRVFIPKDYRIFASIEDCRDSLKNKVLATYVSGDIGIWAKDIFENFFEKNFILNIDIEKKMVEERTEEEIQDLLDRTKELMRKLGFFVERKGNKIFLERSREQRKLKMKKLK